MASESHDKSELSDAPSQERAASRAHATVDEARAKGELVAAYLRGNPGCFIEQAAMAGGLLPRTYRKWMDSDSEAHVAFQEVVVPALHEHAAALLREAKADIDSAQGGSNAWSSWHRWLLPKRHPKLFGEQPAEQKVELSGKVEHEHDLRGKGVDELVALMLVADAVKRGREEGEDE